MQHWMLFRRRPATPSPAASRTMRSPAGMAAARAAASTLEILQARVIHANGGGVVVRTVDDLITGFVPAMHLAIFTMTDVLRKERALLQELENKGEPGVGTRSVRTAALCSLVGRVLDCVITETEGGRVRVLDNASDADLSCCCCHAAPCVVPPCLRGAICCSWFYLVAWSSLFCSSSQ